MKSKTLRNLIAAAGLASISGLAHAASPVGTWTLGYDWNCDGSYSQTTLTVNADGTFSTGASTGTWWEDHSTFTFTYSGGTTYTGYHVNKSMTGVQRASSLSGCWYAHPADGYNYDSLDTGTLDGGPAGDMGPEG